MAGSPSTARDIVLAQFVQLDVWMLDVALISSRL